VTDATARKYAEKGTAQAKETIERATAASQEAAQAVQSTYSTAAQGVQEYSAKVIEFTRANTNATFDYAKELVGVTSPSEFIELSTRHAGQQFRALTDQTTELAALAQKVTNRAAEPLRASVASAFSKAG